MDPVTGLSLGRITIGVVSLARPELVARLLTSSTSDTPAPIVTRMFATREVALGAVTLVSRGKVRRRLVLAGVGVDAGDAAASYLALQDGTTEKRTATALLGVAAGATLAGLASLAGDSKARRTAKKLAKAEARLARRDAKSA